MKAGVDIFFTEIGQGCPPPWTSAGGIARARRREIIQLFPPIDKPLKL